MVRARTWPGGYARGGLPVTLVGCLGADEAGGRLRTLLAREGVDLRARVDQDAATGSVVVLLDATGERAMLPDRGANLALQPGDLPRERFVPGAHLHVSGYTLLDDGPRRAALAALALARERRMSVSVDPASEGSLHDHGCARFIAAAAEVDVWLPNRREAVVLHGGEAPTDVLTSALTRFVGRCVVTDGDRGAWSSDGRSTTHVPAPDVPDVVDLTGAGDAFTAGWLLAWLAGLDDTAALQSGSALAGQAITQVGAVPERPATVRA